MNMTKDFLIEIGTEELPPKALKKLVTAFSAGITQGLDGIALSYTSSQQFASPRRLAVIIQGLQTKQNDKAVTRKGPSLKAAFDEDGCPTPAAEGFARSCGVAVSDLATEDNAKGGSLLFHHQIPGESAEKLLPDVVKNALNKLPIPKKMRWGDKSTRFVRPVHWVLMLLGDSVIDCHILDVKTGRASLGHRFHHPESIDIPKPEDYAPLLQSRGKVLADYASRKSTVKTQIEEAALSLNGTAQIDEELLDEVTSLVEWPVAIIGSFDKKFLDLPTEAIIAAMKGHQKYFHILDQSGKLLPHFITLSNLESKNQKTVQHGNERVIRPRLADAEFFWNQDLKTPLEKKTQRLKDIVFQQQLGTVFEKVKRNEQLALWLANSLVTDPQHCTRAAVLCKSDLVSEMVGEFPELQGIMGEYYARYAGEPLEVSIALREQYLPRFSGDKLPTTSTGQILAIVDKIDTLVGIFGIQQLPTGDKDPFALRRAALSILRIIIENGLEINLSQLIAHSIAIYDKKLQDSDNLPTQLLDFIFDRLKAYYLEQKVSLDTYHAVREIGSYDPTDFHLRIKAVEAFRNLPEAKNLAAANKRIRNILRKTTENFPENVQASLLIEPHEKTLYNELLKTQSASKEFITQKQYAKVLSLLATLEKYIDQFFEHVMVMSKENDIRKNRLALVKTLSDQFLMIADISLVQAENPKK